MAYSTDNRGMSSDATKRDRTWAQVAGSKQSSQSESVPMSAFSHRGELNTGSHANRVTAAPSSTSSLGIRGNSLSSGYGSATRRSDTSPRAHSSHGTVRDYRQETDSRSSGTHSSFRDRPSASHGSESRYFTRSKVRDSPPSTGSRSSSTSTSTDTLSSIASGIASDRRERSKEIYNDKHEEKSWFPGPDKRTHYVDADQLELMNPETSDPESYKRSTAKTDDEGTAKKDDEASIYRTSSHTAASTNHLRMVEVAETIDRRIRLDMRVRLKYSNYPGIVRWIGRDGRDEWVGLEMDMKTYGHWTLFGARWFDCPDDKCEYVLSSRVEPIHEDYGSLGRGATRDETHKMPRDDFLSGRHDRVSSYDKHPPPSVVIVQIEKHGAFKIGDMVLYQNRHCGEIKFMGRIKEGPEGKVYVGLELGEYVRNPEQLFDRFSQFECTNNGYAIYCDINEIRHFEDVHTEPKEPERRHERKGSSDITRAGYHNVSDTITEEPSSEDTTPDHMDNADLYNDTSSKRVTDVSVLTDDHFNIPADTKRDKGTTPSVHSSAKRSNNRVNDRYANENKVSNHAKSSRETNDARSKREAYQQHRAYETERSDEDPRGGNGKRSNRDRMEMMATSEQGPEMTEQRRLKDVSRVKSLTEYEGLELNAMVETTGRKAVYGVIKWIGYIPEEECPIPMVGIEKEEDGTNDKPGGFMERHGVYNGYQLFECPSGRGAFFSANRLQKDRRFEDSAMETEEVVREKYEMPRSDIVRENQVLPTCDHAIIGRFKGIQGHHNSCYLDATLYSMFAFTHVFDSFLHRPKTESDIEEYEEIQNLLREKIVNPLRRDHYVDAEKVLELRTILDRLTSVRGMMGEEKDPEEFLNSLLVETLKAEPFIQLSSGQSSFLYQVFMEKKEKIYNPTVQKVMDVSFKQSKVKLKEVPPCLILQMPRFGRAYKMFDRILPSPELDITDILEPAFHRCNTCFKESRTSWWLCEKCSDEYGKSIEFCGPCASEHQRSKRYDSHGCRQLHVKDRQIMELFAVVCIETSHYVTFTKRPGGSDWVFFDSMADRIGDLHGFNIPEVSPCMDITDTRLLERSRHEPLVKRVLQDAYLCFYRSSMADMYC